MAAVKVFPLLYKCISDFAALFTLQLYKLLS